MSALFSRKLAWLPVLTLILSAACSHSIPLSEFEEFVLFNNPDFNLNTIRLPVIIIPGFKESILRKGDKNVWEGDVAAEIPPELGLNIDVQLKDNFKQYYRQTGISPGANHTLLQDFLKKTGGYRNQRDLFIFSYDWRLDNRIAALQLADIVNQVQKKYQIFLQNKFKDNFESYWEKLQAIGLVTPWGKIKVTLLAHEMGGLIARYYLKNLHGSGQVNKLIMVSAPNFGTMESLRSLTETGHPEVPFSWPSIYQILPRYPNALRQLNGEPAPNQDWGIAAEENNFETAANNWRKYHLVPSDRLSVNVFFKYQLRDAYYFHRAINGNPNNYYEENKLKHIVAFLDMNVQDLPPPSKFNTPVINFGGHCKKTLTYAYLGRKGNLYCLLFDKTLSRNSTPQGDGRIPVSSLIYKTTDNCYSSNFLICDNHTELFNNRTFQYNLLKELLYLNSPNDSG